MPDSIRIRDNQVVSAPVPIPNRQMTLWDRGIVHFDRGSYSHQMEDMNGFKSAKFTLFGPLGSLQEMLDNGLARDVNAFYLGLSRWEGIIHDMKLITPTNSDAVSLERVANKTIVKYTEVDPQGESTQNKTNTFTALNSQNQYGILTYVYTLPGEVVRGTEVEFPAELAKKVLGDPQRQKMSTNKGDPSIPEGMAKLEVRCVGYYWYLTRRIYNKTNVNEDATSTIAGVGNDVLTTTGQFVKSTSVAANATVVNQYYNDDQNPWEVLTELTLKSDSNAARYVVGMWEDRLLRYELRADSTDVTKIDYRILQDGRFQNRQGRTLRGIEIRPNNYLQDQNKVSSFPGKYYPDIRDDSTVTYVRSVEYSKGIAKIRSSAQSLLTDRVSSKIIKNKIMQDEDMIYG